MRPALLKLCLLLAGAALCAGCEEIPAHRARQYANLSDAWDVATRARLLDQRIQLGDTRAMVYVALGPPLSAPTLTAGQPPLEHWEFLVYASDPPFPASATTPLVSAPARAGLRAQTTNNLVFANPFSGPPARLLVVEFGVDDRVAQWRLYPDAQDRAPPPGWITIELPPSPRAAVAEMMGN